MEESDDLHEQQVGGKFGRCVQAKYLPPSAPYKFSCKAEKLRIVSYVSFMYHQ